MKIFDISREIHEEMIVYKNREEKRIRRTIVANHADHHYHESRLDIDMHCGSHMDAPLHMVEAGSTIETLDLDRFIGECRVFDLTSVKECIKKSDIEGLDIREGERVLFKTRNSYDTAYNPKFVYIEEDAASYLAKKNIRCIGIDAMSLERDKKEHPTHKILLGAGVGVVEDLQLKDVEEGTYFLSALPLKIRGAEGSPVRAVLINPHP